MNLQVYSNYCVSSDLPRRVVSVGLSENVICSFLGFFYILIFAKGSFKVTFKETLPDEFVLQGHRSFHLQGCGSTPSVTYSMLSVENSADKSK